MKEKRAAWIEATEAIGLLGVNRATLYAYVSRGHIRSDRWRAELGAGAIRATT